MHATASLRIALLGALVLVGPATARQASAQVWQVTLLRVDAGGERICSNVSATFGFAPPPAPQTAIVLGYCLPGVNGWFTLSGQNATLELTGVNINFGGFTWDITANVRGSGFITNNAIPATNIVGTARTQAAFGQAQTVQVTGSFQAVCIAGCAAPPPPPPPPPPGPGPNPPPPAPGGNPTVGPFNGPVTITPPGGNPYLLAGGNQGNALPPGTRIAVGTAANVTLQFPAGNLALGPGTNFTVYSGRFFLLMPSLRSVEGSFARITWRCVPDVHPCASMATPNTRVGFNPPLNFGFDHRSAFEVRAAGDVVFTVRYTEAGGVGSSVVTIETGTIAIQDLQGRSEIVSAGETRTVGGFAAGAGSVNLNGDTVPDIFAYDPKSGAWLQTLGGGLEPLRGEWAPGWTVEPADFNGDGLTDFVLYRADNARMSALNNGRGGFDLRVLNRLSGDHSHSFSLNSDRMTDLVQHSLGPGTYYFVGNQGGISRDGGNTFIYRSDTQHPEYWKPGFEPHPLKLNEDDAIDLLLFNSTTGEWSLAEGDGAGRFKPPVTGTWPGTTDIFPGDLNGDGRWDVLLYNRNSGAWSVARNTGRGLAIQRSGTWQPSDLSITVGDIDADGDLDVFLFDSRSGRWMIQISDKAPDGTDRFTAGATGSWLPHWKVSAADLNTDGKLDFFLYYPEAGLWAKAINNGAGFTLEEEGQWDSGLTVVTLLPALAVGPLPNEPEAEPCRPDSEFPERFDVAPASDSFVITFINNSTTENRKVYSLESGRRKYPATIEPLTKHSTNLVSNVYAPWVVTRDDGTCLGFYVPIHAAGVLDFPNVVNLR